MKTLHITIIALLSITLLSSGIVYAEDMTEHMTEKDQIQNSTNSFNEEMEEWPIVVQLRAMIAELEAKIAELQEDKQKKNAKIAELRDKLKAKNNQAENQDEKLEAKLEKKNAKIAELETALDNKDAKIAHLKEKVDRKIANKHEKVGALNEKMSDMDDKMVLVKAHLNGAKIYEDRESLLQAYLDSGQHQRIFVQTQLTDLFDIQKEDLPLPPYRGPIGPNSISIYTGFEEHDKIRNGEVGGTIAIYFMHDNYTTIEITEPNNNVVSFNVTVFGGLGDNTPGMSYIKHQLTQVGNYTWQQFDENGEVLYRNWSDRYINGTIIIHEIPCDSTQHTCYGDPLWDGLIKDRIYDIWGKWCEFNPQRYHCQSNQN